MEAAFDLKDAMQRIVCVELIAPDADTWAGEIGSVPVVQGEANRYRLASGEWRPL